MMEAARTSETLVNFYQTTRRYSQEDSHLRTHRRENLKSCLTWLMFEDVTSKENKFQRTEQKLNRICYKICRATDDDDKSCTFTMQSVLLENVPTVYIVHLTTHTATVCIRYQVFMAAHYKTANTNTFILSYLPFLHAYYVLFYAILFLFCSFSTLPPSSPIAALAQFIVLVDTIFSSCGS
jgi:hypothetical protein